MKSQIQYRQISFSQRVFEPFIAIATTLKLH